MKVLSIRQPYIKLIEKGIKTVETRSFKTKFRGKIFLHSSLKIEKNSVCFKYLNNQEKLETGSIVLRANLVDCILMDKEYISSLSKIEKECGLYETGRYAWILKDVKRLNKPIEAKGKLGI